MSDRRIAELSDTELAEEAERRRRRRARTQALGRRAEIDPERILQYFANLELAPGASEASIEESYGRLMQRFDPRRQSTPEKKETARALQQALTEAYRGLMHYVANHRRKLG